MKVRPLFIFAFALFAIGTIHAQTSPVAPTNCGPYNPATYYCPNLTAAGWFYYPVYDGHLNFVGPVSDLAQVSTITTTFDGSQYTQTLTFRGVDYSGSSVITYTTYRGCVSGRVSRCSTYWKITGGTISIQ